MHVDQLGKAAVFAIKLSEGATYNNQNLSLCGNEDGPALYLIHVMAGKLLIVWLRSTDDSEWVLKDIISGRRHAAIYLLRNRDPMLLLMAHPSV